MGRSIKLSPETVDETRRLYVDVGMTITEIAKHLGITTSGVQRRLNRAGVARRETFDKTEFGYDLLHQLYVVDKLSGARIGAKLGITTTQAFALLDHHRIPHRQVGKRMRQLIDRDLLYKLYVVDNLYLSQITEIFGVSHAVIHYNLRQYGLTRPLGRRPRPRFDRDVVYQLYVTEGLSCKATGARLGITIRQVLYLLERHEIPRRAPGNPVRFDPDRELLHKLYLVERCSIQEMRERLGIGHATIYKRLRQYGMYRPPLKRDPVRFDHGLLYQLYVTEGLSVKAVAAKLGVSAPTVASEMRRHEIPMRRGGRRPGFEIDRDLLYNQYYLHSRSLAEIAASLGTSSNIVRRRLDEYGIPLRRRRKLTSHDHEKLRELYVAQALPVEHIAKLLNTYRAAILRELKNAGIPLRQPRPKGRQLATGR